MEQSIINWTKVSELLAGNKTSIRENKFPTKYKKKIEFIKMWEKHLEEILEFIEEK